MGYSHKNKFIFIRPQKIGGTSIVQYLNYYCSEYIKDNYTHISSIKIKKIIGENKFNNYFKFSVTRNPWERLFSLYNHLIRHYIIKNEKPMYHDFKNISVFKKWLTENYITNTKNLSQLNNHIIDYKPCCNYYINYNNLEHDFDNICNIINIKKNKLKHLNKQVNTKNKVGTLNSKDYINFYDDEAKQIVYDLCKIDIDFFGYTFNSGPNKNVSKILSN